MATASEVIKIALDEVGMLEKSSNAYLYNKTANAGKNNYTKYAYEMDTKYSGFYNGKKNGHPWCDVYNDWCFVTAFGVEKAKELLCQPSKSLGAGCKYSMDYYKKKGQLHSKPAVGDQIFFYNSNKTSIAHTGLVYNVDKSYVYTVEGNTSSASGVVANGGAVAKKKYKLSYNRIAGYGRPNYDEDSVYKPTVLEWQNAAIEDGFKFPKYGTDGKWGSECEAVAKKAIVKKRLTYKYKNLTEIVQKVVGVSPDGLCGKDTDEHIRKYQKSKGLVVDGTVGLNTWKNILGI